jgi:hypothetical protein
MIVSMGTSKQVLQSGSLFVLPEPGDCLSY